MLLNIVEVPNEILRKETKDVQQITPELLTFLDNMYETMVASDGVGIAAPQVGSDLKVAIVEVEEGDKFELINPEIIEQSGEDIDVEGCLSIPHFYGTVKRADYVKVRFYDRLGDEYEVEAEGFLARAFQHEIDHLHGILFTDHLIEEIKEEDLESYYESRENEE